MARRRISCEHVGRTPRRVAGVVRRESSSAFLIAEEEAKAGRVVETGSEAVVEPASERRPVVLVTVGIADQRVEDQVSDEPVEGGCHAFVASGRTDALQDSGDRGDVIARPVVRMTASDAMLGEQLVSVSQSRVVAFEDPSG